VNSTINATINETQSRIIALVEANPRITVTMMSAELGINERNVKYGIKALKDAGLLERVGANRNGHWVVKRLN